MMEISHIQRVRRLYKTILRLHRGLPPELGELGTNYARDEFKRHKKCSEHERDVFMHEWSNYALQLADQLGLRGPKTGTGTLGKPLSDAELEALRDEQIHQLYELMQEASKSKV